MAVDFKKTIKENNRKSILIILTAFFLYAMTGLFVDFLLFSFNFSGYIPTNVNVEQVPQSLTEYVSFFFNDLLNFDIYPIFTIFMMLVALGCLLFGCWDQEHLMLSGQQYKTINIKNNFSKTLNEDEKKLFSVVEDVKIASGVGYMPKVVIMNSPVMNAFASGYNEKNALICVSQGLLDNLKTDELRAVLAHEMTHIKNNDIKISLFFASLSSAVIVASEALYHMILFGGSGNKRNSNGAGIVFLIGFLLAFFMLRFILPFMLMFLRLFVSRKREYMADAGAVQITRDNTALGNALVKISNNYKYNNYKDENSSARKSAYIFKPEKVGFFSGFSNFTQNIFSTHPTINQRLIAINYRQGEFNWKKKIKK